MNYLYQHIETIRNKPAMYIGRLSITALYDYLGGFQAAMHVFGKNTVERLFPLPFLFFHRYVANHYNNDGYGSAAGWRNIILEKSNSDEEKGLWTFYELFDSFKALSIKQCFFVELSKENISYHYTNKFSPKSSQPPDYEKTEPLYINPIEVYMIELTHNAGYLCMINTKSQHRLESSIYKDKGVIEEYLKQCFGFSLDWKCIEIDDIVFSKELLY